MPEGFTEVLTVYSNMTLDGYILNVIGPFLADGNNNDASIAKSIFMNNEEDILNWLKEDDIIVVDRGFGWTARNNCPVKKRITLDVL